MTNNKPLLVIDFCGVYDYGIEWNHNFLPSIGDTFCVSLETQDISAEKDDKMEVVY